MENGRLEKHSTSSTAARPAPTFITARPDSICMAICILQTSSCSNAALCNGRKVRKSVWFGCLFVRKSVRFD